ncbi:MAG: hypothetical protein AAF356_06665 [Planctomycetota bacterium]
MLWRLSWFEDFEMGWLLESSDTGCAFAWRGVLLPSVGSRIDINTDARARVDEARSARIQRVAVVHDDLMVVACDFGERSAQEISEAETERLIELARGFVEPMPGERGRAAQSSQPISTDRGADLA